jgi:hypothetical protein
MMDYIMNHLSFFFVALAIIVKIPFLIYFGFKRIKEIKRDNFNQYKS